MRVMVTRASGWIKLFPMVGLVGIEPATSALSGRSAESCSVPMRPSGPRFRCSSGSPGREGENALGPGGTGWDSIFGTKLGQFTAWGDRIEEASKYCGLRAKKMRNGLSQSPTSSTPRFASLLSVSRGYLWMWRATRRGSSCPAARPGRP